MRVELPHYYCNSLSSQSFTHHLQDTNNMESKNIINLKEVTSRELKVNRTLSSSEDDKRHPESTLVL